MISKKEYQSRRRALASELPSNAVAIIPGAREILRTGDAHHRFRQDSDFYYLTGFNEPDALLLITCGSNGESILFNQSKDIAVEQWTGVRLGQADACEVLGVDYAYPIDSLSQRLPELLADKPCIYYTFARSGFLEKTLSKAWKDVKGQGRTGIHAPEAFCDLSAILGEMRLIKSESEIALMQEAAQISVAAHRRAMRASLNANYEYQLEAELVYEFTRQGCRSVAYDPIVASGENACILHYTANNKPLDHNQLVLIDAGGEFENYAADITRTFPVGGQFNAEQRQIYELVLKAQKAGMARIQPGCRWNEAQQAILQVLVEGLVELNILKGCVDDLIAQGAYKPFYMHNSGHWLGLDVHDCGHYRENSNWRALESGMVLTVEPGLYFHPNLENIDSRWLGIGVRIEDDVCVTDKGYKNLTGELEVEIDELEAIVRGE